MKERCDREWPQRSFWCSLGKIWRWDHNPRQLNNQQRGSHRRLGNAHGAHGNPEAASFRRARNASRAALASCIMPPNLLGHTMPGPRAERLTVKLVVRCRNDLSAQPFALQREARCAAVLGISRAGAYKLAHSIDFPAFQIGRRIVVSREKFIDWLNRQGEEQKCA